MERGTHAELMAAGDRYAHLWWEEVRRFQRRLGETRRSTATTEQSIIDRLSSANDGSFAR